MKLRSLWAGSKMTVTQKEIRGLTLLRNVQAVLWIRSGRCRLAIEDDFPNGSETRCIAYEDINIRRIALTIWLQDADVLSRSCRVIQSRTAFRSVDRVRFTDDGNLHARIETGRRRDPVVAICRQPKLDFREKCYLASRKLEIDLSC